MWPPGFTHDIANGAVTARDGTGTPVAQTDSRVMMAGGLTVERADAPPSEFKDEWNRVRPPMRTLPLHMLRTKRIQTSRRSDAPPHSRTLHVRSGFGRSLTRCHLVQRSALPVGEEADP